MDQENEVQKKEVKFPDEKEGELISQRGNETADALENFHIAFRKEFPENWLFKIVITGPFIKEKGEIVKSIITSEGIVGVEQWE